MNRLKQLPDTTKVSLMIIAVCFIVLALFLCTGCASNNTVKRSEYDKAQEYYDKSCRSYTDAEIKEMMKGIQ